MYQTLKEKKELAVKKAKNGKGVFVKKNFKPGQSIFQFAGELIACDEDDDTDEQTRSNAIRISKDWFVSPKGRMGDFLNHSCEPNAKVVKKDKKLFIVAISLISKGEEVAIDYSTIIAADDSWTMKCKCGSKNCRKMVGKFKSLPKKLRDNYLALGLVPKHILG